MNSFRSLVYLPVGANATRVFCRDSGLVQGDLSTGMHGPSPFGYANLPISRLLAICSVSEPSTSRRRLPALCNATKHSADVMPRFSVGGYKPSHFTGNVVSSGTYVMS